MQGQTRLGYALSETVTFEPNLPSMFITRTPDTVNGRLVPDTYKGYGFGETSDIDQRLLKTKNYEQDPSIIDLDFGVYKVVTNTEFCASQNGDDSTEIDDTVFPAYHQYVIKLLKRANNNVSDFYNIYLYAFGRKLREGEDYRIDWNEMKLYFHNMDVSTVYRMVAVADSARVSPILKSIINHGYKE